MQLVHLNTRPRMLVRLRMQHVRLVYADARIVPADAHEVGTL